MLSSDIALEKFLAAHPAEIDPENGLPMFQPLPHEWSYDTNAYQAERMTVILIDLGHGSLHVHSIRVPLTEALRLSGQTRSHSQKDSVHRHFVLPKYFYPLVSALLS